MCVHVDVSLWVCVYTLTYRCVCKRVYLDACVQVSACTCVLETHSVAFL